MAKDAADIVLLDKDLGVLADGVMEGRRIFANTLKYVLMATSSNFGNMVSAAGASLFLSFLPMLPSQILLNGLLYDAGQLAIPTDNVDPEVLARPAAWDIAFVRRFMGVFGPISSIFDFMTFFVMLHVLHASHDEFRTGWFVESLATQTLVVFLIRTRRVPFFRSRPSLPMIITPITCAVDRSGPAVHAARRRPRLHRAAAQLLPHPDRDDRHLPRPRRDRQEPLLRHPGPPPGHAAHPRAAPPPPRRPQSVTLHPPPASGTPSWASARDLRPRSIWRDMTKSAGTMTRR